jgi:hemerythrin-like domain-containing protein
MHLKKGVMMKLNNINIVFLVLITINTYKISMCSYNNKGKIEMKENQKEDIKNKEEEIPPTEDLMREHGVLNRVLLIYDEIIRRLEVGECPLKTLFKAVSIIREFIENYHEKLEENHIFPLFEKSKKEVKLVKTLRNQHNKGREITAQIIKISSSDELPDKKTRRNLISLLKKFVKMYRPHEAREDTVLFPKVRSLISEKEFKELGEQFEDLEHKLFGKEGFFSIVKKVENIEKELGIYKLEQFTPELDENH